MLSLHQTYISLFEQLPGYGFLNVQVFLSDGTEISAAPFLGVLYSFLFIDMLSYVAVFALVFTIGARYNTEHSRLTALIISIAGFFCYFSLIASIFTLFLNFDAISGVKLHIFSGLYMFTSATQIFKIVLLLLTGALYTLFPRASHSSFRSLELPLLMQITLALCVTILSANNFALILLALEGFSLTLYIMTALGRTYGGITASVKYFAFGTLGSIFLF